MESTRALASNRFEQERKSHEADDRQKHPYNLSLVDPRAALCSPGGSTNHPGAVSSLCQGLELIRSHTSGLGHCWGHVCSLHGAAQDQGWWVTAWGSTVALSAGEEQQPPGWDEGFVPLGCWETLEICGEDIEGKAVGPEAAPR